MYDILHHMYKKIESRAYMHNVGSMYTYKWLHTYRKIASRTYIHNVGSMHTSYDVYICTQCIHIYLHKNNKHSYISWQKLYMMQRYIMNDVSHMIYMIYIYYMCVTIYVRVTHIYHIYLPQNNKHPYISRQQLYMMQDISSVMCFISSIWYIYDICTCDTYISYIFT